MKSGSSPKNCVQLSSRTRPALTYDSAGNLFSMTRGSETYFYHTNARGDVVALSDSTGAVVNTYTYDPWGTLLAASETVENPYRYASYRYDEATGLSYCWNRYYAPELARFLTRDIYPGELSYPVTMNPYLHCGGDPVNAVDPSGMSSLDVVTGVLGAVLGLAGGIAAAAELPVIAAACGAGATGLILETPIASAVAHAMYSAPVYRRNIATAESWEQMSAQARAEGRCDAADEMDTLRAQTVYDLEKMRAQSRIGVATDTAAAVIESIVAMAGYRVASF